MASLNISYDYFSNYSSVLTETLYSSYVSIIPENNVRMVIFLYMYMVISVLIFYKIISYFVAMDCSKKNEHFVKETEDVYDQEEDVDDQEEEDVDDQEDDVDQEENGDDQEQDYTDDESESNDEENYPELYNFFQFQLTKKKLVKIVGSKYKNLNKKDLVKFALEKFKSETINNSLENFKYFSSNFKSYLKSNNKLYQHELVRLFNKAS